MKKLTTNVLFILDQTLEDDPDQTQTYNELYINRHLKKKLNIEVDNIEFCSIRDYMNKKLDFVEKILSGICRADIIFFDYGGLYFMKQGLIVIDYWNRLMVKWIEQFQGKDWYCVSQMATFDKEDEDFLSSNYNVKFLNTTNFRTPSLKVR